VILVPIHRAIDIVGLGRDLDMQRFEFKVAINQYLGSDGTKAEVRDLTALVNSRKFHPGLEEFLTGADTIDLAAETERYNARLAGMAQLRNAIMSTMADFGVVALAYPLQRRLVVPIGAPGQPDRNGIVAALTGFPAITVPAGFSAPSASAPLGVPVGMDLLGRPWSEQLLLDIAFALESLAQFRKPPRSTHVA
jgi:amidase